jgi:2-dehydropantoate 2-reductase
MALAIGARLARVAETAVTLCGSWTEGHVALARRGVVVHDAEGTWSVPVASARAEDCGRADIVLVLVKSHQTAAVAPLAARAAGPAGAVVTLQNGLGNREALAAASDRPVVSGVTTIGATLLGPGEVRVLPGRVTIGAETGVAEAATGLAALLRAGGIEAATTPDLAPVAWAKLAVNCSVNPLTALAGCPNGALLDDEASRETLRAAACEVGAVAAARGIRLPEEAGVWALRVARATAENRSSMLQDVERGARTEIDALCGAVSREGRHRGVPTPVNQELWRRVRLREGRPVRAQEEA